MQALGCRCICSPRSNQARSKCHDGELAPCSCSGDVHVEPSWRLFWGRGRATSESETLNWGRNYKNKNELLWEKFHQKSTQTQRVYRSPVFSQRCTSGVGSGPDRPAAGRSLLAAVQAFARCYLCTAERPLPGCGAEIGPVPSTGLLSVCLWVLLQVRPTGTCSSC